MEMTAPAVAQMRFAKFSWSLNTDDGPFVGSGFKVLP
jgi:hypothetical protein